MRAIVFVRRTGADGAGHVGWGFECGDRMFNVGSIENQLHSLRTRPDRMGFWDECLYDPIAPMRHRAYTHFKLMDIPAGHPSFARQVVAWLCHHPYDVFRHNCMDATYDVLRAFGVAHLPAPAHHWEPNHWFDHIQAQEYRIDDRDVIAERGGGERAAGALALPDIASLSVPQAVTPAQPSWRIPDTPEWRDLQQAIAEAPPMPHTSERGRHNQRSLAGRIRHWLGLERAR